MKRLLTLIILTSIHLSSLAQNEVFRIDSIPTKGILLDKGWKWHAGDNPDWAKPNVSDSQWETINPVQDIISLKQLDNAPIFWLRLHLKVNSTLRGKTFALSVKQTGASQFFLNGQLISEVGHVSTIPSEVRGYDPMGEPISLPFSHTPDQYLAIRFSKADLFLIQQFYHQNPALQLKIATIESSLRVYNKAHHIDIAGLYLSYFKAGIFLLFAFLHLWLYNYHTDQKSNLYFSIWSFLTAITYVVAAVTNHINELAIRNTVTLIFSPLYPVVLFIYYHAITHLFKVKKGIWYKFIVIFFVVSFPMMVRPYQWGWLVGVIGLSILTAIEVSRITWRSYKKGNKAALMLTLGEATYIVLVLLYTILKSLPLTNSLLTHTLYNIGILAPAFALSYYLASQFEKNRKSLQQKLVEVQQLAEEKQNTLIKQNAELQAALLQGQTIERKRVAADLHDSLGSTMSSLIYTVNAIDINNLDNNEKNVYLHLKQMLDTAYNEIRLLSHNLLPEEFEKQGLTEALRHFIRKINQTKTIQFDLSIDPHLGRLSPKIEFELYSICLELINNILKHAHATQANVKLLKTTPSLGGGGLLTLVISDNGRGFFDNESDGKGMKNVKARVESLNGTWHTKNTEGNGVCNEITVPI